MLKSVAFDNEMGMKKTFASLLGIGILSLGLQAGAAAPAQTYRVKSGDTLDKVIRRTMADSPLKIELLRKAYIAQNPQAFVKTSPPVLRAGVVLSVPNHDDLLRQYLRPSDGMVSDPSERRHWVRYP